MTKGAHVTEGIKKKIADGTLKPGDRLPSEAALCQQFSMSRTSIRSAINTLVAEGVIVTLHGKGSFVSQADSPAINRYFPMTTQPIGRIDMFEFRRIFESESAALAAARADERLIRQMKENVARMQTAETPKIAVERDMEFHYLIAVGTQNAVMPEIYNMLKPAYEKMFTENVAIRGNEGYKEHLKIVSSIESRNPEQARKYMADHLNQSMMQTTVSTYMEADSK